MLQTERSSDEPSKTKKLIKRLEKQNISAKPWFLQGEVDTENRPDNVLLEEYLSFDYGLLRPPQITEGYTKALESILKQRVKDKAWDDVERIAAPIDESKFRQPRAPISSDKSKIGLADIYEESYINQLNKVYLKSLENNSKKEESKEVAEIRKELKQTLDLLDALTNQNFAPNPIPLLPKFKNNQPALNLEEIIPVYESEHVTVAPEEIDAPLNKLPAAPREMTDTDKNRQRRKKKIHQRNKYAEIAKKMNQNNIAEKNEKSSNAVKKSKLKQSSKKPVKHKEL